MRVSAFIIAACCFHLLACRGRLPLVETYEDVDGHRLYLYKDSLFIARVGYDAEQFYRRPAHAYGNWSVRSDSTLVLKSNWQRNVGFQFVLDSSIRAAKGLALKFVDDRGYSGDEDWWFEVYDDRDSLMGYSLTYSCFVADRWSPWVRIIDTWDMIELDTIHIPDSAKHWNVVKLNWRSFDHDGSVVVLRDYELTWDQGRYTPRVVHVGVPQQDPQLRTLSTFPLNDRKERKYVERIGWNMKQYGRPFR